MWLFGFSVWMSAHSGSEFGNNPLSEPPLLTGNTKAYIKHEWVKESWSDSLCSELSETQWDRMMCVFVNDIKWFLTWRKLLFVMTWETIENRKKFTWKPYCGSLWGTSAIQDETDRRVAIGNTTLIVLVHFSNLKLRVWINNIKSKIANVPIFFFIFNLKHCFSPVHLWVAKYTCISVWNDWETISRWHTQQLHHGGSNLRQQAARLTDWVQLKGILAQKK